ncbi:MAG: hypothetical protein HY736_03685 [Verrucomicrobia bacterium]|nr:hypothetical protein [Verrucomicrobiota bacterium]
MPSSEEILTSLGLDRLIAAGRFTQDAAGGVVANPAGARVVCAGPEVLRSLHLVFEKERAGTWTATLKTAGFACGKKIATGLDAELAALGKPALAALPIEACLVFVEHYFAVHGWGRLKVDLADAAEHGVVIARLEQSFFAAALQDPAAFADPLLAGVLQGFFEHISGQTLGCEEIACARRGAPHCIFVITSPERLGTIVSFVGYESAEAILQRLRA